MRVPKFALVIAGDVIPFANGTAVVFDLTGLDVSNQVRPVRLFDDARQGVGHTESVTVRGDELHVAGFISRDTEAARDVASSLRAGFPWQATIGAQVYQRETVRRGERVKVNGRTLDGPLVVVRAASLVCVTFTDEGVGTSARLLPE